MRYETILKARDAAKELESKGSVVFRLGAEEVRYAEILVEGKSIKADTWFRPWFEQAIHLIYFAICRGWRLFGATRRYPALREIGYFCNLTRHHRYKISNRSSEGADMVFYHRESDFYRAKSAKDRKKMRP